MVDNPRTQMNNNIAVDIAKVTKIYGSGAQSVRAIDDVSLQINDNEFLTLLGPSGCGKTTLLRMIAGFEDTTNGHIHLFGDEIENLLPNERPVNTVFQHYALFPHLSVFENVAFGLRRQKRSEDEVNKRCQEVLALTQMEHLAERRPNQLSGGQQQRVALARALAPHPKVLLLDEPLSALDLKLRQAMRYELKQLQQKTGITFIFVTHDQEEALAMSDRIVVMSDGKAQQVGTPKEIYERPANVFVANFVGEANLLKGTCIETGADGAIELGVGAVLSIACTEATPKGAATTVMIRPEHVEISQEETIAKTEGISLPGILREIVYLGSVAHFEVECAEDKIKVSNSTERIGNLKIGDQVHVRIAANKCRVLLS